MKYTLMTTLVETDARHMGLSLAESLVYYGKKLANEHPIEVRFTDIKKSFKVSREGNKTVIEKV